ncbi:hypothetical protein GCM10007036_12630 [Alsobacter metallidurans]|uniref:Uncharacterized protein n=1 Tax=Alsobacter metallidurans TaxID=340221 RepID=A0A917MGA9_9HYPH|nr:hypothetical protein [Alsobacter metallidurans]GGH13776.1 hypothetical protein GCM10007036_12630 [Alsobacter metallidurans]
MIAAFVLAGFVSGCSETGDLGRPKPTLWGDAISPLSGKAFAAMRGEAVSLALLTDDEQELRARAYRFLMPARERWFFDRTLAELAADRIVRRDLLPASEEAYFQALMLDLDRSPRARYQRLREDVENDRELITVFAAVVCRVAEMDKVRLQALGAIPPEETFTRAMAFARVAENEMLARWVEESVDLRLRAYRFALERLVVTSPDKDAIRAERTLDAFEGYRGLTSRCIGPVRGTITVTSGANGARFLPRTERELPPK